MRGPLLFPTAAIRSEVHYVWRGASILIVDNDGMAGRHSLTGFYFRQTRFLRDLQLEINGEAPYRCSVAERGPNVLELSYMFPEVKKGGGGGSGSGGLDGTETLLYRDLDLRLDYRVYPASLEVTLRVTNRWQDVAEFELSWLLAADYTSMDDAHFGQRNDAAETLCETRDGEIVFRYQHPALPFETRVVAEGPDWDATAGRLTARLSLQRQQTRTLRLRVHAVDFEDSIEGEDERRREARLEVWHDHLTEVFAPGETPLVEITNRALRDVGSFALLEGRDDEWLAPAAGVPLYLTFWGRDGLTTAWQAGLFDRGDMLADVLVKLDRLQGERIDPWRDEEPGRIINQAKSDPGSRLGQSPFQRYYADFASPFMFIIGLGYHYALTGDKAVVARHWDAARRVLDWARNYGDRDGDGYLEYLTQSEHGPSHQGWKDSENAVVYDDGRHVKPPIAPCEVQGYYYVSLQFMAVLSAVMGERTGGLKLWGQAKELKERFNRDFWIDDEGFLAFGLDAEKRQIRALTSNAGHALATGIVTDAHVPALVRRLFEPDLFSGWGIRTLSTQNPAYNPLDYHLGSVWPVENGTILFGLRRYGLNDRTIQLARALYDLARLWPDGRIPECIGGYARDEYGHPGSYPRSNTPQTWNQSMHSLIVQALLGLVPFAPMKLLLVDPILPPWLPELTMKRLRVGEATVSLRFYRDADGKSHYEVTEQDGKLRILRQPWLQSFSADLWGRFGSLADSLRHH